jgi:hypothetical protein
MSASEGCSKEGSTSDGYPCRYACCPARTAGKAAAEQPHKSGIVRESYTLEDSSRFYKENQEEADRKPFGEKNTSGGGSGQHRLRTLSSANQVLASLAAQPPLPSSSGCLPDLPIEWKAAPPEKDLKKWREMETTCLNGAQVWRERGDKRERVLAPCIVDSMASPPPPPSRRAVRSETPDDDSVSFHETLGRELR